MKILVVQEADWMDVGVHDSHHIFERLQRNGHEVKVINHEFRWRKKQRSNRIFSPRHVERRSRVISNVSIEVITPAYLRLIFFDYISVVINHRREIARQIREYSPDVIVGLGIFNSNYSSIQSRKSEIAFAYYILDELHKLVPNRLLSLVSRLIESQTIERSNDVIVTSLALREYVLDMGAREETIHYVPHGYEKRNGHQKERKVLRQELKIDDEDTVLLFMGWLYDFSGLLELTEEIIKTGRKNLKLLVIGKGDIENQLTNLAEGRAKDILIMTGWVPFNDLFNYLNAADICIMPFKNVDLMQNSVPIKIIEYMAAGKPVISTPLNGIVKEFGQNNGIIYAIEPEDFISAIYQIEEDDSFSEIGLKALQNVENREWEQITSMFEKILIDAVKRKKGC